MPLRLGNGMQWLHSFEMQGHSKHCRPRGCPAYTPSYLTVFAAGQSLKGQHALSGGLLQLLVPLHRTVLDLHLEV